MTEGRKRNVVQDWIPGQGPRMTEGRKYNAVQDWIPVETTRMTEGRKCNAVQDWIPVETTRMTEGCGISYAIGALAGLVVHSFVGLWREPSPAPRDARTWGGVKLL